MTRQPPKSHHAVGYVRVSTEEQGRDGVSLDAQEERVRAYATSQGLELTELVREVGVSGAKPLGQRAGGAEVVRLINGNRAHHVVALKLDRLFRDAVDALNQTRAWDKKGIALHLLDLGGQSLNTASAMGRMFLTMAAAFAELERNLISERTHTALAHMKTKRRAYSPTPFGFDRTDDGTLIKNSLELCTVTRARRLRARGFSYRRIADALNEQQLAAKNGGRWYASSIHYVLNNTLYDRVVS